MALVAHGLNVRPEKMDSWARVLANEGTLCLRMAFTGHHGDREAWAHVTNAQWLADVERAYRIARSEADARGVPLDYLGYSLGALMAAELAVLQPDADFHADRMILLAPALSIHLGAKFLGWLSFLGESIHVPSLAVPEYRANANGTSLAAYHALSEGVALLKGKSLAALNSPTLVIMDPDDGLVSYSGLKRLVRDQNLDRWHFLPVTTAGSSFTGLAHHFLVDETAFGNWVWSELTKQVTRFLRGETVSAAISRADYCAQSGVWKTRMRADCRADHWPGCDRAEYKCSPVFPAQSDR